MKRKQAHEQELNLSLSFSLSVGTMVIYHVRKSTSTVGTMEIGDSFRVGRPSRGPNQISVSRSRSRDRDSISLILINVRVNISSRPFSQSVGKPSRDFYSLLFSLSSFLPPPFSTPSPISLRTTVSFCLASFPVGMLY